MGKEEKIELVKNLSTLLRSSKGIYFTDYRGLNVKDITDLRSRLRDTETFYKVIKNSILKRALEQAEIKEVSHLVEGPIAIAITSNDPIQPIKILALFRKEHNLPHIKGGIAEGKFISEEEIDEIAKIPSREELLSMVVGSLNTPITGLIWTLKGMLAKLIYTLNSLINKKEEK